MTTPTTPSKNGRGVSCVQSVPNWETLIPAFVSVLRNPKAEEDRIATITGELIRLAIFADTMAENLTSPPNPSFYATRAAKI